MTHAPILFGILTRYDNGTMLKHLMNKSELVISEAEVSRIAACQPSPWYNTRRQSELTSPETGSAAVCPPTPQVAVQHASPGQLECEVQRLLELVIYPRSVDTSRECFAERSMRVVRVLQAAKINTHRWSSV